MSSFYNYLMAAENQALLDGQGELVHASPEGGNDTVGFGHKLNVLEDQTRQVYGIDIDSMTLDDAKEIMRKDVHNVYENLGKRLGKSWDTLNERGRQMLVDLDYNIKGRVEQKFPNFTKAVLSGDLETQRKEYERSYTDDKGHKKPLTRRNSMFWDRFLAPEAVKAWGAGEIQ